MAKILIVEDEPGVVDLLRALLAAEQHTVEAFSSGQQALAALRVFKYDLVILDLKLPDLDGMEVCRQYRAHGGDAPIVMLTARGDVDDRASGLDAGADDYLAKPFHVKELSARVRALLRRPAARRADILVAGQLKLDLRTRTVEWTGRRVPLIPKEFDILAFLMRHEGEAFSAEQILERVWPSDASIQAVTIRTHIKNIRRKTEALGAATLIQHVRGLGYVFEASACSRS